MKRYSSPFATTETRRIRAFDTTTHPDVNCVKIIEVPSDTDDTADVDIVFSFDTTGSMKSVIETVKANLATTVDRLFTDIPNLRIGVIVHGDYCDYPEMFYQLPLTKNKDVLQRFIREGRHTSGGDYEECYELVLKQAVEYGWKAPVKILVMIGDATPHEEGYALPHKMQGFTDVLHLDWRHLTDKLKAAGVMVFACHALPKENPQAVPFWKHISSHTGGFYFSLEKLTAFNEYMVAMCLKAADGADDLKLLQQRVEELETQVHLNPEKVTKELHTIREALRSSEKEGVFSPAIRQTSSAIREQRNIRYRTEKYEKELQTTTPLFFGDDASAEFMSSLSK